MVTAREGQRTSDRLKKTNARSAASGFVRGWVCSRVGSSWGRCRAGECGLESGFKCGCVKHTNQRLPHTHQIFSIFEPVMP